MSSGSAWMTEGRAVVIFIVVSFTTAGLEKRLNCVAVFVITNADTAIWMQEKKSGKHYKSNKLTELNSSIVDSAIEI